MRRVKRSNAILHSNEALAVVGKVVDSLDVSYIAWKVVRFLSSSCPRTQNGGRPLTN